MSSEQLQQLLTLGVLILKPMAAKSKTEADDIAVELLEAIAKSPAMLDFISRRALTHPEAVTELFDRIAG